MLKKISTLLVLGGTATILLSGCQNSSMKGTPFYTGEYEGPKEGYTDRVNLWPALYYRNPALSILWPLFERTDEHTALRPLYSVYDKKESKPTYNACWPIARFDTKNQSNRIFPFFWGKDGFAGKEYFVIAPLYWHVDDPFDGDGENVLFPFWIWSTHETKKSLHLMWPIFANEKSDRNRLWRIWPLYGYNAKNHGKNISRFWGWPLGGSKKTADLQEHYLFPLYYAGNKTNQDDLWTLLGGRSISPDSRHWAVFPALSWGEKTANTTENNYLLGLAGNRKTPIKTASHLFPIYAKHNSKDSSSFLSVLYYRNQNSKQNDLWTLLGGRSVTPNKTNWAAFPALSWGEKTSTTEKNNYLLGLAGKRTNSTEAASHILPIYAKRKTKDSSYLFSALYSEASAPDGSKWNASLPFFHKQTDASGATRLLTPLFARKTDATNNLLWKCYFPFVHFDKTYDAHFMTPLGGRWRYKENSGWLAMPILSGGTKTPTAEKIIWAAGLAGRTKSPEKSSHYICPLYYACSEGNQLISPLYLRWKSSDGTQHHVIPPLLGGTSKKGDISKTALLAGIASWEKDKNQLNRSHVIPLYGWKRDTYLLTPFYGKNKNSVYYTPFIGRYLDKKGGWVFPLWEKTKTENRDETNWLLGFGTRYKTPTANGHSLFPFWNHEKTQTRKQTDLLLGLATRYKTKTKNGHFIFPLYNKSQSTRPDWKDKSLTQHKNHFNALLLFWNTQSRIAGVDNTTLSENSSSGLFPLWMKHIDTPRDEDKTTETANILFRLYDYRKETPHAENEKTYTRHRILWRIYHKETLGADSSADIFPAITIDKKENGFKKVSFLWRLFRYEKDPEKGTTEIDLLFIPLKRS